MVPPRDGAPKMPKLLPEDSGLCPHSNHQLKTDYSATSHLAIPSVGIGPVLPVSLLRIAQTSVQSMSSRTLGSLYRRKVT